MTPTKEFEAYLQACVLAQIGASRPDPADVFAQRLWGAVEFDWFRQTGTQKRLIDAGGLPRDDAAPYARLVKIAGEIVAAGGVSSARYDEYYKLFPNADDPPEYTVPGIGWQR